MNTKTQKLINTFNSRIEQLISVIKTWLVEEKIEFSEKVEAITLDEGFTEQYQTKRVKISLDNKDMTLMLVPSGIKVIGTEGKVELRGESGFESIVYLKEQTRYFTTQKLEALMKKEKGFGEAPVYKKEGWHWLDDSITGKKPEFCKDIFFALLERIN